MDTFISVDEINPQQLQDNKKILIIGDIPDLKNKILSLFKENLGEYSNRIALTTTPTLLLAEGCIVYRKYSPLLDKRIFSDIYSNFILFDDILFAEAQIQLFYKKMATSKCMFIDIKNKINNKNCDYDYVFIINYENEKAIQYIHGRYPVESLGNYQDFLELISDCLDNNEIPVIDTKNKCLLYYEN